MDFKKIKSSQILDIQKRRKDIDAVYDEKVVQTSGLKNRHAPAINRIDDNIAIAMDDKKTLLKLAKQIERLKQTRDVQGFIQDVAPHLALETVTLMLDPSTPSKVKADLLKDMLDRAGYGKVTKHAVARFDADSSKAAIISAIIGSKKDLGKAGIEIVDDEDDKDHTPGSGETHQG